MTFSYLHLSQDREQSSPRAKMTAKESQGPATNLSTAENQQIHIQSTTIEEANVTTPFEKIEDSKIQSQLEEPPEPLYSIYTHHEKALVIVLVSFLAIISPLSSLIYLPALPSIAKDLDVSISLVNLTVTTYLVS